MQTRKFKTTIKCSGCVAAVTPFLDEVVGHGNWSVDVADPAKPLTIPKEIDNQKVIDALQKAGYKGEPM